MAITDCVSSHGGFRERNLTLYLPTRFFFVYFAQIAHKTSTDFKTSAKTNSSSGTRGTFPSIVFSRLRYDSTSRKNSAILSKSADTEFAVYKSSAIIGHMKLSPYFYKMPHCCENSHAGWERLSRQGPCYFMSSLDFNSTYA